MQTSTVPKGRIPNAALLLPDVMKAFQALGAAIQNKGVEPRTLLLSQLRASQINGCSVCVEMHAVELKQAGESDERMFAVAAWRESPYFNDAERAALALTEAATRLADSADPVPDAIWAEAAKHYDERALAALVGNIAVINAFNRINVTLRTPAGPWTHHIARAAAQG